MGSVWTGSLILVGSAVALLAFFIGRFYSRPQPSSQDQVDDQIEAGAEAIVEPKPDPVRKVPRTGPNWRSVCSEQFIGEIQSEVEGLMDSQRDARAADFRTTMVGVVGQLENVENNFGRWSLKIETIPNKHAALIKFGSEWETQINGLERGHRIAVIGRFTEVRSKLVFLEGEYLIPLFKPKKDTTTARSPN